MTDDEPASGRSSATGRLPAVLGIFGGGLVHALLLRGAFGAYDILIRAVITGLAAGATSLLLFVASKRWSRSSSG